MCAAHGSGFSRIRVVAARAVQPACRRTHGERRERDRDHRRNDARGPAVRGAAAARALRAHPVVPQEVSVLRLQFARGERRCAGGRVRRRAARRPRVRAARDLGPPGDLGVHRRRHAESLLRGRDRSAARGHPRPRAAVAGRRGHAGGESGNLRAREVRRIPGGGNQPALARDPEFRSPAPRCARPRARRGRGAPRGRSGARALPQRQLRPDVRAAAAERGRRRGRSCGGTGICAAASFLLSPDARAQHAVPPLSAAAAGRGGGGGHRGRGPRRGSRRPGTGITRPPRMPMRAANAGTISITGASAITSVSARARIRSFPSPTGSCASCATSSRSSIWSRSRRERRCRRAEPLRARTSASSSC